MISLDSTNLSHLESFNKNRYRKHSNKDLGAKCYFAILHLLRGRLLNTQNTPRTLIEYADSLETDSYFQILYHQIFRKFSKAFYADILEI